MNNAGALAVRLVVPMYIIIIIIINEYLEAGLTTSISIQHSYCRHELQKELY